MAHILRLDTPAAWKMGYRLINLNEFQVTYLEAGESLELLGRNGAKLSIQATAGPVLGPPWQRPENGYSHSFSHGLLDFSLL